MAQYAVDIVFEAFDKTNATFESIMDRARQFDAIIQKNKQAAGGDGGGDIGGRASAVDGVMSKIMNRFLGVAGLRMGIDAVTAGIKRWQYETSKLSDPLEQVLEKQVAARDAVTQIAKDIPVLGGAISRMMDAFGQTDNLKRAVGLVQQMENSVERTVELSRQLNRAASDSMMKSLGFPESANGELAVAEQRRQREEKIKDAQKAVEQAKEVYQIQKKIEDAEALRREGEINAGRYGPQGQVLRPYQTISPDRLQSDRTQREKVDKAQKALDQLRQADQFRRMSEEMEIEQLRQKEAQAEQESQDKLFKESMAGEQEKRDQTLDNLRRIDEARARGIRDELEREKENIRIKYKYEIQQAKEAGQNTDILDMLKDIEMDNIRGRTPRMRDEQFPTGEVRFMSYGDTTPRDYLYDIAGHGKRQSDLLAKIARGFDKLVAKLSVPRMSQPVSNFR